MNESPDDPQPVAAATPLVVGVSSSALFDLDDSDGVFRSQGIGEYRKYQEARIDDALSPGIAFPFVRRLLSLNDLAPEPVVDVVVVSRNSPETGQRVLRSAAKHGLPIVRSCFLDGEAPYPYMTAFGMSLFLTANEADVRAAVGMDQPAGQVLPGHYEDNLADPQLRIAFDFDGVLADDESEKVFATGGLQAFESFEEAHAHLPHQPGLLKPLLVGINRIQALEEAAATQDSTYERRVIVSLVTARGIPAHERALYSLRAWGLTVNQAFFLGGHAKAPILQTMQPHLFFDDQLRHLVDASTDVPSVHVPFGLRNA